MKFPAGEPAKKTRTDVTRLTGGSDEGRQPELDERNNWKSRAGTPSSVAVSRSIPIRRSAPPMRSQTFLAFAAQIIETSCTPCMRFGC